jgi:hypothetical protein
LLSWKTHGIVFGIVAATIFLISDKQRPDYPAEAVWSFEQMLMFACVGFHVIAWSYLDRRPLAAPLWAILSTSIVGISTLAWIEARLMATRIAVQGADGWVTADQRIRMCLFIFLVFGGLFGLLATRFRAAAAWVWALMCLAAPIAGYGAARLFYDDVRPDMAIGRGHWERIFTDLGQWFTQPNFMRAVEGWCWTEPWVVLPLMVIGLWRALARGFRQRRKSETPIAWLVLVAALPMFVALLPVSTDSLHPIGLLWLGVALSVFAVADLSLLVYEQLALPVPEAGPSKVPHV